MYEEKPIAIASVSEMNFIALEKSPILQFDCTPILFSTIISIFYVYISFFYSLH